MASGVQVVSGNADERVGPVRLATEDGAAGRHLDTVRQDSGTSRQALVSEMSVSIDMAVYVTGFASWCPTVEGSVRAALERASTQAAVAFGWG